MLYVVNFDGTVFKVIPCEPAPPASVAGTTAHAKVRLHPNVPNPFSTATEVIVELDRPTSGRLALFEVSGCEVVVLNSGNFNGGRNVYHIDATRLPSGVYRCHLALIDGTKSVVTMICVR